MSLTASIRFIYAAKPHHSTPLTHSLKNNFTVTAAAAHSHDISNFHATLTYFKFSFYGNFFPMNTC